MNDYSNHIVIVGAGIAGLALGNILKMHNIPCIIFEKNENISEYGAGISISPNGLKVLEYLEVLESFNEISRQPIEATFFSNEKKLIKIPVNVSTATRKNLYKVLFNKYLSMGGNVIFDHEVSSISLNKKETKSENCVPRWFSTTSSPPCWKLSWPITRGAVCRVLENQKSCR